MDRDQKLQELAQMRRQAGVTSPALVAVGPPAQPLAHLGTYYATTGLLLGMIAAAASLFFNIVGSLIWSQWTGDAMHPLRLIQVYLTFPMGERALEINHGTALAVGCVLYLATGAIYGAIFELILTKWFSGADWQMRLLVATAIGIGIWLVNFYGILNWLQPLAFGGNWIVELIPWWVAGLTHLVFAWTMWLIYPLGIYPHYRIPTDGI